MARSTLSDYQSMFHCYLGPYFGDMQLDEIDASTVGAFQLEMRSIGVSAVRYGKVVVPLRAPSLALQERDLSARHDVLVRQASASSR